jgi:hypothetical protein
MKYVIPRGIKVKETVAYGMSGKQILYLASGLSTGISLFSLLLPLEVKIAGTILSIVGSLALSLAKRHGQELDKYIWNSVKYPIRNKEWSDTDEKKEAPIAIRFHSRQPSAV